MPRSSCNGAKWFWQPGTEHSKGHQGLRARRPRQNTGLIEVPMGTTLREIVFDIGGGIPDDKNVQGRPDRRPVGRLSSRGVSDTPVDYESLTKPARSWDRAA